MKKEVRNKFERETSLLADSQRNGNISSVVIRLPRVGKDTDGITDKNTALRPKSVFPFPPPFIILRLRRAKVINFVIFRHRLMWPMRKTAHFPSSAATIISSGLYVHC